MPTIEELIMGQIPEPEVVDPAMAEREKQIWEKINRGPRERAKELAGEAWKDQYGIDEKSGGFKRGLAALGDSGRAFLNRNNKNFLGGIAQESKTRGMEEYKAEVPILQRELGVISQAKTAAAKMAQKAEADRLASQVKAYMASMKGAKDLAQARQIDALTDPKVKELAAKIAKTEAQTSNINVDTDNDRKTLGMGGQAGLTAAMTGQPGEPGELRKTWADMQGLSNALKGAGVPKVPTQIPGTSGGSKYVNTDQGLQLLPVPPTTRTTMQADPEAIKRASDAARARFLGVPVEAPPAGGIAQSPPPQPRPEPFETPDGRILQPRPNAPARTAQFKNGQFTETGLDPTWAGALKDYTGGLDPSTLPAALKIRFPGKIFPGMSKQTDAQKAQSEFRSSVAGLADESMKLYANNELSKSTGIPGNLVSMAKSMMSDGLDMSAVKTRSQAVATMANYILEKSGKAVTENERRILNQALPNLGTDSDSTLLQKTLVIQNISRRLAWKKQMRLSDDEMERVLRTPAGQRAAATDQKVYAIVDSINKATRNGKREVVITNARGERKTVSKQQAMDLARATMGEDYRLLTEALQETFK